MLEKALTLLAVAVLLSTGCSKEPDPIDPNTLPPGDATGTGHTGEFTYSEVVTSSSCPDRWEDVDLPREGSTRSVTVSAEQDDGYFRILFPDLGSDPGAILDGGIDRDGTFRIGGDYYCTGTPEVIFVHLMDGEFRGGMDEIEGHARIGVTVVNEPSDPEVAMECELRVEFEASRR